MRQVLISGAGGFIGTHLSKYLKENGYDVFHLVRKKPCKEKEIYWDGQEQIDNKKIEGLDAAIHLAGENIAAFWTKRKKRRILESRISTTRLLAQTLQSLSHPPKTFICASAVGFYGDQGDEVLLETNARGEGFLSDVCESWEKESHLFTKGRVVNARFGLVLSKEGGFLKRITPLFSKGFGSVISDGKQWMSWIALIDLLEGIIFILNHEMLCGPVNLTSPHPVTNRMFTETLARTLKRKLFIPIPAFFIKCFLGQMGEEMLLYSTRALPQKLLAAGKKFSFAKLEDALLQEYA